MNTPEDYSVEIEENYLNRDFDDVDYIESTEQEVETDIKFE